MKRQTVRFIVELEPPPGATLTMIREYIATAVKAERGARDPLRDPMAYVNRRTIKVKRA